MTEPHHIGLDLYLLLSKGRMTHAGRVAGAADRASAAALPIVNLALFLVGGGRPDEAADLLARCQKVVGGDGRWHQPELQSSAVASLSRRIGRWRPRSCFSRPARS